MKEKKKPEELRMKASEFEETMRRALGASPIPTEQKAVKKPKKRKK